MAFSQTMVAKPIPAAVTSAAAGARLQAGGAGGSVRVPARRRSPLGWVGESIAYIYVYLRGKLDAEERRRRLVKERAGAEALLTGALNELGLAVLREGVQHPDFTGLLEAVGRAHARRESAAADMASSETLQQAEAARLATQESAAEAESGAADKASRDAEEILRSAMADRRAAEVRLARVKDDRARLERDRLGTPAVGEARAAELEHEIAGLTSEQEALTANLAALDRQLAELRSRASWLRTAAGAAKSKMDQAVAARRKAAAAMAASIAGRLRDRADAEREVAELTSHLGRVAAEVRPSYAALFESYGNIDRLTQTIADRGGQLAALEQARGHYDQRKLLTGVGLLATLVVVVAAALWAVFVK